jgi:anti-sigma factor RsiW
MGCRRYQRLIALNRSGELRETEVKALAAHIRTCSSCAREAASMGDMRNVLGAAREIPCIPDDPDVLTGKILDRIATKRVPHPSSSVAVLVDRLLDFATLPVFRVASA